MNQPLSILYIESPIFCCHHNNSIPNMTAKFISIFERLIPGEAHSIPIFKQSPTLQTSPAKRMISSQFGGSLKFGAFIICFRKIIKVRINDDELLNYLIYVTTGPQYQPIVFYLSNMQLKQNKRNL